MDNNLYKVINSKNKFTDFGEYSRLYLFTTENIKGYLKYFDLNGKKACPYEGVNIKRGDVIIKLNNENINGVEDFISKLQKSNGDKVELTIKRGDEENLVYMIPVIDKEDNAYKLGLWVKEITSGVGTVTYIDKNTGKFGALGHGINDVDGTSLLGVRTGKAYKSLILAVEKGKKGSPGELKGAIRENEVFGTIEKNTATGIYGVTITAEMEWLLHKYLHLVIKHLVLFHYHHI